MAVAFNFEIRMKAIGTTWTLRGVPFKRCHVQFLPVLGIGTKNGSIVKGMTRKLDLLNEVASGSVTGVVHPKILALLQESLSVHESPWKSIVTEPVDAASKLQKDCHQKDGCLLKRIVTKKMDVYRKGKIR